MATPTTDRIIYLGPSLAALNGSKPVHATPIEYNSLISSRYNPNQQSVTSKPSAKKRPRPLDQIPLHDDTVLASYQPKRRRTLRQSEVIEEQRAYDDTSHISSNSKGRKQYSYDPSNDSSQQSSCIPQETSDEEADYPSSLEEDTERTQIDSQSRLADREPPYQPISKAERLKLGPARVVGMTRTAVKKAPLLRAIERTTQKDVSNLSDRKPISEISHRMAEEDSIAGATTVESIPPPPTHAFSLSNLTLISTLISSPSRYLSAYQGGGQHEGATHFNLLALIVRVGALEDTPDWKTGGRRRMDRCEIIVKDASECALKVVLERDCAANWAAPRDQDSIDNDQLSSIESLAEESQSSSDVLWNSLDASLFPANNQDISRTRFERRKDELLLPIRPGDVVVLSHLCLVRPRSSKARHSSRFNDAKALGTHAVASPSSGSTLEICWRSSVQRPIDQRRNFDKCLTAFDARCRAIYHLAQSWSASSVV